MEKKAVFDEKKSEKRLPNKIKILAQFSFQVGMPGRNDVMVTLTVKEKQLITDQEFIKRLIDADAPYVEA